MSAIPHADVVPAISENPDVALHARISLLEQAFDAIIGNACAVLVMLEVAVLFSSVVARYVFRTPLIWSDEVASMLFLWLAMLGSVVALRRGQHMRMTTVISKAPAAWRPFLETLAVAAAFAFLAMIAFPSYEYAVEELHITTPALEIANTWRASALPIGTGLMLLASVMRLARMDHWRAGICAIVVVALVTAIFWQFGPILEQLGKVNLVIFFLALLGTTVLAGVPIAFCFGLATFGYLSLTTYVPLVVVVGRMDEGMSHLLLLAVPMFVFLGVLLEATGMARAMIVFLASLLGHARGGLSYVLVGAMYLVSGISGSKFADMAAVAPALFPEMKKRGAKPGDLAALLAATGAQTETIPPSLVLITIGSVTGISISALFTGGLLPSLVLGVSLCAVVWWQYRGDDLSHVERAKWRDIGRALGLAIPALILPFVIRISVVEGVATATEVSTIGIVYTLLMSVIFFQLPGLRQFRRLLIDTAVMSGSILLIIGCATAMAWALAQSGFSRDLAYMFGNLPGGRITFLMVSIVVFIILGSLLEGIPAIVLLGPLLFPIAKSVGVHEVHYAMIVILAMGIGLFAPPFGLGYYTACAIGGVDPEDGMRATIGYMTALIAGLVVVALVPWISIGFLD